jgi:hypothetical protein
MRGNLIMSEKHTLLEDLGPIVIQTLLEEIRPGARFFIGRAKNKRDSENNELKGIRQIVKGDDKKPSGIGKYLLGLGVAGAGTGAYALRDKIAGLFAGHHDDNDDEA